MARRSHRLRIGPTTTISVKLTVDELAQLDNVRAHWDGRFHTSWLESRGDTLRRIIKEADERRRAELPPEPDPRQVEAFSLPAGKTEDAGGLGKTRALVDAGPNLTGRRNRPPRAVKGRPKKAARRVPARSRE